MFTGIVEKRARVVGVADGPRFKRLTVACDWPDVRDGQSIAVNGVCLTVAEQTPAGLGFDVVHETLAKTNLGDLQPGDAVNVERAMRIGDRIDGHFVQGHVDGTGTLLDRVDDEREVRLRIRAPDALAKFLIPKGSICIDGVSLTVAAIDGNAFEVALIPTTLNGTTLGTRAAGWPFNLEADILSKTIVTWLENRSPLAARSALP